MNHNKPWLESGEQNYDERPSLPYHLEEHLYNSLRMVKLVLAILPYAKYNTIGEPRPGLSKLVLPSIAYAYKL